MPIYLRAATASQEVPLGYFLDSTDGNTEETGLTIANTDIKVWKAGATTLANKNSGGATHIANGVYYAVLDATDTNTVGSLVLFVHVSGALACRVECVILPAQVYDSLIAGSDLLDCNTSQLGGTSQTGRDVGASVLLSSGTGTGQVSLSSGTVTVGTNNDKTGYTASTVSDKTGYSLSAAGIQAVWDALTSALTTVGSVGKLIVDYLDAAISSRLASASYTAPLDAAGIRTAVGMAGADLDTQLAALPTAAENADAVWEEAIADHSGTAGSTAEQLAAAGAAGDPWATALPGAYSAGQAGKIIGDNIDATISSRLAPTTAARTLDVTAGGCAGVDWANVEAPTTTVGLAGTTVKTATDVETDTADIQSRLPAALVSGRMSSDAVAISGSTTAADNVEANIGNLDGAVSTVLSKLLKYVQLLLRKDAAIATDNSTELTAINADGGSGAGSVDNTTDSQEAIRDNMPGTVGVP